LRTSDFLDVPHHPLITYRSTEISRVDHSTFHMLGDLTIRGVTNPLALEFHYHGATTDAADDVRLAFTASTVISRRAWGVSWSGPVEAGGVVVADEVTLELDVSALRVRTSTPAGRSASTTSAVT
jgi:polyisoprenoid-binding protein YceI